MAQQYRTSGVTIQPQASPTDTFVRPQGPTQVVGPSALSQLAEALQQFSPGLSKYVNNRTNADLNQQQFRIDEANLNEDIKKKQQIVAGRQQRAKSLTTFGEAVKRGDITPDQNPWYIKAWKEDDGSVAADRYNNELLTAMATGPLSNATSHDQANELMDSFRSGWMKENGINSQDSDFINGFASKAAGYEANARRFQTQTVSSNIVKGFTETFGQKVVGALDEHNTLGLSPKQIAEGLNEQAKRAILVGVPPAVANQEILNAVIQQAVDSLDVGLIEVLDHIKTGTGTLSGTVVARERIAAAKGHIFSAIATYDTKAEAQRAKALQIEERDSKIGIASLLSENDKQNVVTTLEAARPFLDRLKAVDPDQYLSWVKHIQQHGIKPEKEDEATKINLTIRTFSPLGVPQAELDSALFTGKILQSTYLDLAEKKRSFAAAASSQEEAMFQRLLTATEKDKAETNRKLALSYTDPAAVIFRGQLESFFQQNAFNALDATQVAAKEAAVFSYLQQAAGYFSKNPEAAPKDKNTAMQQALESAVNTYNATIQAGGGLRKVISAAPAVVGAGGIGSVKSPTGLANTAEETGFQFKDLPTFNKAQQDYINDVPGAAEQMKAYANSAGLTIAEYLLQQQKTLQRTIKK